MKVILVHVRLTKYINHILVTRLDSGVTHLPATAAATLVIYRSGSSEILLPDGRRTRLPGAFIEGPCLLPRCSIAAPQTEVILVKFRPGALGHFLGLDVAELVEQRIALSELAGHRAQCLQEYAASVDGVRATHAVQAFLLELAAIQENRKRRTVPMSLPYALLAQPAHVISDAFGLSQRQFERRFLSSYGIHLREIRRLLRFWGSIEKMLQSGRAQNSLATLAQDAGYFDQSHFGKEFKTFCGVNPSQFGRHVDEDDAFWIFRSEQAQRDLLFFGQEEMTGGVSVHHSSPS